MKTSEFDYFLPKELIAQTPALERDGSRLMVIDAGKKTREHKKFTDIINYLHPGDLLVLNDTRVIPAQIEGIKERGSARIEVLLLGAGQCPARTPIQKCLVKPGKRLKVGSRIIFDEGRLVGEVLQKTESGEQIIEFKGDLDRFMREKGELPLPPYIFAKPSPSNPSPSGRGKPNEVRQGEGLNLQTRYQTVYAQKPGAMAAPTAGLHFTEKLLQRIRSRGAEVAFITLHTGLATFRPVYVENIEEHRMHQEYFEVPAETIQAVKKAKRVIAVGTTVARTLENFARTGQDSGETDLFIYPGFKFKIVDALITNFHFPRSTLLMLVSAFAGREFILSAYQEAISEKYRFFSFGDAMFIHK